MEAFNFLALLGTSVRGSGENHDKTLETLKNWDGTLTLRLLTYLDNYHETPTVTKPTIAGIHFSERGNLAFTLRFPCVHYYVHY